MSDHAFGLVAEEMEIPRKNRKRTKLKELPAEEYPKQVHQKYSKAQFDAEVTKLSNKKTEEVKELKNQK